MSPPNVVGLANGLAQSTVSFARFFGPAIGGAVSDFFFSTRSTSLKQARSGVPALTAILAVTLLLSLSLLHYAQFKSQHHSSFDNIFVLVPTLIAFGHTIHTGFVVCIMTQN